MSKDGRSQKSFVGALVRTLRKRAAIKSIECNLTADQILLMIDATGGRCSMTRIPFDLKYKVGHKRPYAPSIDRIDSSGPYSAENCRIVCVAVNLALNEFGDAVFNRIASAYIKPESQRDTVACRISTERTMPICVYPRRLKCGVTKYRSFYKGKGKEKIYLGQFDTVHDAVQARIDFASSRFSTKSIT